MSYELNSAFALSGEKCRYAGSRLPVRGPERDLKDPYVAFLGGTEVYGRFVDAPFPAVTETLIQMPCVNFGGVNAGLDSFLQDRNLMRVIREAEVAVVQILGAQNLSNKFYRVHPRRNDRFLAAQPELMALYPEVDFTEFHFNKHLLTRLQALSQERFETVRLHLQSTWVSRMGDMIAGLDGQVVLLWLQYSLGGVGTFEDEPVLVDRAMVDSLRALVRSVVELPVTLAGVAEDVTGMTLAPLDLPAARLMLGPKEHTRVGSEMAKALNRLLPSF